MKDAINRVVGVVDETGAVISCSELNLIDVYKRQLFHQCVSTVFSEPPVDNTYAQLPEHEGTAFAVEYLDRKSVV